MLTSKSEVIDIDLEHVPSGVEIDPPKFEKSTEFSKFFDVEVAIVGDDFVFHFFLPKPKQSDRTRYWLGDFPIALDRAACDHFKAGPPRLRAQHVTDYDLDSWWLRANGFAASVLDPDAFVRRFYQRLQSCLEASNRT